jgi:hypothetical protein
MLPERSVLCGVKDLYLGYARPAWQGNLYFYLTAEVAESAEKSILGRKNLPQSAMDDWHAS